MFDTVDGFGCGIHHICYLTKFPLCSWSFQKMIELKPNKTLAKYDTNYCSNAVYFYLNLCFLLWTWQLSFHDNYPGSGMGYLQVINSLDSLSLCVGLWCHIIGFLYNRFWVQVIVLLVNGFCFPTFPCFDKAIGKHFVIFNSSVLQSCDCVWTVLLTRSV